MNASSRDLHPHQHRPVVVCFANARLPDSDYRVAFAKSSARYTVRLALPERPHALDVDQYVGISVGAGLSLRSLWALASIPVVLLRQRASLALFFATQFCIAGPVLARIVGVSPIMTITGLGRAFNSGWAFRAGYIFIMRINARLCRAVLFQNQQDMARLARSLSAKGRAKCHLIGSGIDTAYFPRPDDAGRAPRRCLMVARLLPDKGVFDFLALAESLSDRMDFVLVGPPSEDHKEALDAVRTAAAAGRIEYLGALSSAEVRTQLRSSEVLVLPSKNEGLPRVALEAALSGCVTVGYDIPGTRAALGGNYPLVAAGDVAALSQLLLQILADEDLRSRLARESWEYVMTYGTSRSYIQRLEDFLR